MTGKDNDVFVCGACVSACVGKYACVYVIFVSVSTAVNQQS